MSDPKSDTTDLDRMRREQSERVMPLIGGLLDGWDGIANDEKDYIRNTHPLFFSYIENIQVAMEGESGARQSWNDSQMPTLRRFGAPPG